MFITPHHSLIAEKPHPMPLNARTAFKFTSKGTFTAEEWLILSQRNSSLTFSSQREQYVWALAANPNVLSSIKSKFMFGCLQTGQSRLEKSFFIEDFCTIK